MAQPEHRISARMIEAAREGDRMSLATLLGMFENAGITSGEDVLRAALRLSYYNAEAAAGLLRSIDERFPGLGDQFIRDYKVRAH